MRKPLTDLDHARNDRDGWIESALRAERYVAELQAENARLWKQLQAAEIENTALKVERAALAQDPSHVA